MVMEEQELDMELASERVPVPRVQKSKDDSRVETNNKVSSGPRGKPRLRKKALHAAILKQMEFYFSDANLTKDRFLGNLIQQDPYIDLSIFIRFNKIRELTTDTSRIAKALQGSTILSLSEDGAKVCRVTPVVFKENTDDCTVYVQNLPADANHEMLSSIFAQYGHVAYVSLPRFKNGKKIKGFAFIEFDTPETADKCIASFRKKGCVLPSNTTPDELMSITTFDNPDKDVTLQGKSAWISNDNTKMEYDAKADGHTSENGHSENNGEKSNPEANNTPNCDGDEQRDSKKAKKRKHKTDPNETSDTESMPNKHADMEATKSKKKKHKHSSDDTNEHTDAQGEENKLGNVNEDDSGPPDSTKKNKDSKTEEGDEEMSDSCERNDQNMTTEDIVVTNSANEEQDASDDKKKKRKRKRRSRIEDSGDNMGLQVMSKKDWKYLRNKYLELQRSKMNQLKQHLRKTRWNQWSNYEKNKPEKEENDEKEKPSKPESTPMRGFSFTPGVIVKIDMQKPCTDPKSFKNELRGNSSVKYIDVDEGSECAYVRCDTIEAARLFAQKSNEDRQMTILKDEEEKTYWDKILQDRDDKLGKKVRIKQRGRTKLLKKAEKELGKHIKFDEV